MSEQSNPLPANLAAAHWQRWEMGAFDAPPKSKGSAPSPGHSAEKAEETLKALKAKVQKQAYDKGYAEGFASGKAEGLAAGHAEGHQQGLAQATGQMQEASKQHAAHLATLFNSCSNALQTLEADVGQQLIDLAIGIAQQVLRTRLHHHPETLAALVEDIIASENPQGSQLRIRVHPDAISLLQPFLESRSSSTPGNWLLVADPSLQAGDCIAESAQGAIDARLDTRWQRVIATLGRSEQNGS